MGGTVFFRWTVPLEIKKQEKHSKCNRLLRDHPPINRSARLEAVEFQVPDNPAGGLSNRASCRHKQGALRSIFDGFDTGPNPIPFFLPRMPNNEHHPCGQKRRFRPNAEAPFLISAAMAAAIIRQS